MTFHSDDWAWSAPRICTDVCGGCSAGWPGLQTAPDQTSTGSARKCDLSRGREGQTSKKQPATSTFTRPSYSYTNTTSHSHRATYNTLHILTVEQIHDGHSARNITFIQRSAILLLTAGQYDCRIPRYHDKRYHDTLYRDIVGTEISFYTFYLFLLNNGKFDLTESSEFEIKIPRLHKSQTVIFLCVSIKI